MAQLSIDTLNKTDRDNAMVALHNIAKFNGEDPLFCSISHYNDLVEKFNKLSVEYQKNKEDLGLYKDEYNKQAEKIKELLEANTILRKNNEEFSAEIEILNEKLRGFIPGYGGEGVMKYYKPSGDKLETTVQDSALFMGVSVGENVFEFQFNEEKGPHQKAIQNKTELLLPFCDTEYEAPEANYIENKFKGSFSLINGEFKMIEKAKICMVKK